MAEQRCETCKFWRAAEDAPPSEEGWCRRHAPAPFIVIGAVEQGHASERVVIPFVDRHHWCGEWQDGSEPVARSLPQLLDADDVAHWLGKRALQIKRMATAGEIPSIRLPDESVVFDQRELALWIEKLRLKAE